MEPKAHLDEHAIQALYEYAAQLLFKENKNKIEVMNLLAERGMTLRDASDMIDTLQVHFADAKKSKARKNMLYGALWCIGGTVVTVWTMNSGGTGFIAWGAIVFGGIQFISGLVSSM